MRDNILLVIKGLIIGLGKIIPGVSGGVLAIALGIYEKGLEAISHFFRKPTQNMKFLSFLGLGILISIVLMSKVIRFSLNNYYLPTMLLFVGLIAGGLPVLFEKIKKQYKSLNILLLILSFGILTLIFNLNNQETIINNSGFSFLVLMGIIDAFTMVVPGVSGTAILMLFGAYDTIIGTLSNITNFSMIMNNLEILLPFIIGMIIGIIVFVNVMTFLFKKYNIAMYFIIIGLAMSSTIIMVFQSFNQPYTKTDILFGLILFMFGYFFGNRLDNKS